MTRDEHLAWCKKRALKYLDYGDVPSSIASMMSDLNKHEETRNINRSLIALGILYASRNSAIDARHFIEGFR